MNRNQNHIEGGILNYPIISSINWDCSEGVDRGELHFVSAHFQATEIIVPVAFLTVVLLQ